MQARIGLEGIEPLGEQQVQGPVTVTDAGNRECVIATKICPNVLLID